MSTLYMVRCNYSDPTSVADWEHWYSGEKQDWLLSRPLFRAGQRFSANQSADGVGFAALYTIDSPDALQTSEYKSGWGWLGWKPNIVDWTRHFLDGVDSEMFLTEPDEQLVLVFVDQGTDPKPARQQYPDLTWVTARPGLDEELGAMGIGKIKAGETVDISNFLDGVNVSVFNPASPVRYAEHASAE